MSLSPSHQHQRSETSCLALIDTHQQTQVKPTSCDVFSRAIFSCIDLLGETELRVSEKHFRVLQRVSCHCRNVSTEATFS